MDSDNMDKESPTPSMAAVWLLFSIAVKRDYEVALIDADTAFLNAAPNEAVYVSLPQGYSQSRDLHLGHIAGPENCHIAATSPYE